jgi:MFS family permease
MRRVLPIIVISQFFCTSVWFATNAVMPDIVRQFNLAPAWLAHLTSAVQGGFIAGTLVFAILSISDRFSPSRVFVACSIIAALSNIAISFDGVGSPGLLIFRFLTGFFLAGIYPVGMRIAADYYQQGLGKSLGFLVGALVLGTAFPHLLKSMATGWPWKYLVYCISSLALIGGLTVFLAIPDGPFRKPGQKVHWLGFLKGFRNKKFRAASFGYFGHMWELYTFWAFIPVILDNYKSHYSGADFNTSLLSFFFIASGGVSCALGGIISQRAGIKKTATVALATSCCCCLLSPLLLLHPSLPLLIAFLLVWGMSVTADSPLFSTLTAQHAPPEVKGAAMTIVISIGFAITIVSMQMLIALINAGNARYIYMLLAIGPLLGLIALFRESEVRRPESED